MKRLLVLMLAVALVAASSLPVHASPKAVGRWQGVAIGLGAVSLYNLFNYGAFTPVVPPRYAVPAPAVVYSAPPVIYQAPIVYQAPMVYQAPACPPPAYYDDRCGDSHGDDGYYSDRYGDSRCYNNRNVCAPERVWAPGYWQERHRWVPGHWEWE